MHYLFGIFLYISMSIECHDDTIRVLLGMLSNFFELQVWILSLIKIIGSRKRMQL